MKITMHAVIGLTIYKAMDKSNLHPSLKKLVLAAAVIGSVIPDIDLLFTHFGGESAYFAWHRGITHSIFFLPVFLIIIWLAAAYITKMRSMRVMLAAGLGVSSHLFFDLLNQWGTGLLEPFCKERFSLGTVSFIDIVIWVIIIYPFFTSLKSQFPNHVVFKGAWVVLSVYICIQTIMGFIVFENLNNRYEKLIINASVVPGIFKVVGKDGRRVDILKASALGKPIIERKYISDDSANLTMLFSGNNTAETLYKWAPITVVVSNKEELGVFDARFYKDGWPAYYEFIKK